MIRTVHLVYCDRCPDSAFTPINGHTIADAREAAKDNGWTRPRTPKLVSAPAYFEDVCPACTAKTKEGAL